MNDITPPKKTLSEAVAQADASPAAASNVMPKSRRWPKVLAGVFALLLVAGAYIGWQTWNNRNYPPKGTYAIVGTQSESQKNFDEIKSAYIKFDQASAAGKNVDAAKTERRAADEVILRLALQDEAKKLGKLDCSQQKVDEVMKDRYAEAGGRAEFYNQLQSDYGWTERVTAHKECLEYYRESLQDSLISSQDLFGVYVRWDIALEQPNSVKKDVERKAVAKLTSEYLPLFEAKKSDQEIANKADVNESTSDEDFNNKVISLENPPSRIIRLPRFNAEVYKSFQQYSEGEDETNYVSTLAEGGFTKVFKSKTGYYIIYRSTKKYAGAYESYDQMLAKVLETAKVNRSYLSLPEPEKVEQKPQETGQGLSWVSKLLYGALRAVTPRAEAATPNSIACYSSHKLPFTVEYRDAATKNIIQSNSGQIKMTSTGDIQTPCKDEPAVGKNPYGVDISYNQGAITYSTGLHPNPWSFGLTCYTSWKFSFGAPTGYEEITNYRDKNRFYLKLDYASSSYSGYTASEIDGQYKIPSSLYRGIANGAKGFTIRVYFSKKPAVGKLKVSSVVKTGTSTKYVPGLPSALICSSEAPDSTDSYCHPMGTSNGFSSLREWAGTTDIHTGVYNVAHTDTLSGNWSLSKVSVTYPADCYLHKGGVPETFQTRKISVRVCENQTPEVTFYFTDQVQDPSYAPWIQSRGGNVLALGDGGIEAQSKSKLGSAFTNFEAEYVVMAFVSENFCSSSGYNLGLTTNSPSCVYAKGYEPEHNYNQNDDPVIKSALAALSNSAQNENSCNSRKPYYVRTDMTTRFQQNTGFGATAQCPVIGVVNSNTYPANHYFKQGRATLYNKPPSGTLTISADNTLQYTGSYSSVNEIPNVGLIVEGNVVIAPNVTNLDMSIYASGKIMTCSSYPSAACNQQLRVRGMLAAGKGFVFGRNIYGGPAELIIGSGLVEAYPPPGFIDLYSENVRGVRYLTTNGNPRF